MTLIAGAVPQTETVEEPHRPSVVAPQEQPARRSWSRLALFGPAFVASIAYVDPGNFVTNVQAGARYGYLLLWCVLGASLLAMPVQYLSAKLGVVTAKSLPELSRATMPHLLTVSMWIQAEAVAICTDIAEFVGAAIGLNLIFGVPIPVAGALTAFIAFVVLRLQTSGSRRFETAVVTSLALIAGGFIYETLRVGPSARSSLQALVPHLSGNGSVLVATGIVGATVMPHAVYLHSALTRNKAAGMSSAQRSRLLSLQRTDVTVALGAAAVVNMAMLAVAAKLFHNSPWRDITTLGGADRGFSDMAGGGCALIFAVALFVSGASSSAVGTLAGQTIMSGYTGRSIPLVLRRSLTMAPALALMLSGYNPTRALLLSQVALSFGLPFALVPLVIFTAKKSIMADHVNGLALTLFAASVVAVITGLDSLLLYQHFR